jgi:uncharacterized protein (TIGR03643 family)
MAVKVRRASKVNIYHDLANLAIKFLFPKIHPISMSRKVSELRALLSTEEIDRIVQMAWEDRTPFDAILAQFGVKESEVIALMKAEMRLSNWKKWRARVQGRATKHRALRQEETLRFKSRMQRAISGNRISKR